MRGGRLSAVIVPRAFFRYSIEKPATMKRASSGSAYATAMLPHSSARFASAIACTLARCWRTARRSRIVTFAYPSRSSTTWAPIVPV